MCYCHIACMHAYKYHPSTYITLKMLNEIELTCELIYFTRLFRSTQINRYIAAQEKLLTHNINIVYVLTALEADIWDKRNDPKNGIESFTPNLLCTSKIYLSGFYFSFGVFFLFFSFVFLV